MRKRDRQRLIETLILREVLSTQADLVQALKAEGCEVTQATVSRDMREMGVQKGTDSRGSLRYVMPARRSRRDPAEVMARVLRDSGASARRARNLVVVRCEPGTAPAVGRVIDEFGHEDVVGTVAGDDTVMMAIVDDAQAAEITKFINNMVEGREQNE